MILDGQYPSMFEADLGDGEEQELCENGSDMAVTPQNKDLFAKLYLQKYLEQDSDIYDALIAGVKATSTDKMLRMLTSKSGPLVAFSNPKINVEALLAQLKISEDGEES